MTSHNVKWFPYCNIYSLIQQVLLCRMSENVVFLSLLFSTMFIVIQEEKKHFTPFHYMLFLLFKCIKIKPFRLCICFFSLRMKTQINCFHITQVLTVLVHTVHRWSFCELTSK